MSRAFWKGVISFGMVVIPVRMYVATETSDLSLHLLHKKCLTRPKQVLHCEQDNEYFSQKETVRGYEYAKGQFIVLEEKDFEKVPVRTAHSIDIQAFVSSKEIDPIYYQNSHYLEPEELGAKPFAMLRDVLQKTNRIGIAKVSFQRKEHLCALRPYEKILALHTLYYPKELVSSSDLESPKIEVSAKEAELANSLVEAMLTPFQPDKYRDEYREGLKKVIDSKLKGVEVKKPEERRLEVTDLMSALKASLESAKKKGAKKERVGV
jgi:DNA end-binding protein Ku